MGTAAFVTLALFIVIALWAVAVYNRLRLLGNRVENAWSQIDVQLKRRYELIPNLVEVARGYMQHEAATLEAVTRARTQAVAAADSALTRSRLIFWARSDRSVSLALARKASRPPR